MSKITQSAISRKPIYQEKGPLENIFLHLYTGFGIKIQNTNGQKSSLNFFDMCKIDTCQMAQKWHTQKSKIG